MIVYFALLRGINVGASKRIKMDDLRQVFWSLGFIDVQTYIQSGNVIFTSDVQQSTLIDTIDKALLTSLGFAVSVVIRSAAELNAIISRCSFSQDQTGSAAGVS